MHTTITSTIIRATLMLGAVSAISGTSSAEGLPASDSEQQIRSASAKVNFARELPVGLYEYFHDARLHKPDSLGNYGEDYRFKAAMIPQLQSPNKPSSVSGGPSAELHEYFHDAELHSSVSGGLSAELYEYFHDPESHKPDDLGNYSENYRLKEFVNQQNELVSAIVDVPRELPRDLNEYLHDADLHKPDGLGTYAQNLRRVYRD